MVNNLAVVAGDDCPADWVAGTRYNRGDYGLEGKVKIMPDEFMTKGGCDKKHEETMGKLNEINNRLYKDNGQKSIQSRLNEQEAVIATVAKNQGKMDGALTRLFWAIAVPLISGSLWVCWIGFKYLITTGKL